MTRDDVIRMAEAVDVKEYGPLSRNWSFELSQLERFAQLVAAHEREECAKVCDEESRTGLDYADRRCAAGLAADIRARGTA